MFYKSTTPEYWGRKSLGELIQFALGGDWGKEVTYEDPNYDLAYCIRGSEIRNWEHLKATTAVLRKIKKSSISARKLEEGDILIEISGGGPEQPVGRTVLIDRAALNFEKDIPKICTNFLRLIRPIIENDSNYLHYYLKFFYFSGEIIKYQGGSNNLRNLKFPDYLKISIPLPPISEQQQIVSKIEELFSELDKGNQQLETVKKQLNTYRQSVLKWAFEGRFTSVSESAAGTSRDLSHSNDNLKSLPEGWKWVKLGEVCKSVEYGSAAKSNEDGKVPVLRMGNIQKGKFDWADLVFTSNEEEILKYTLNKNDVLFNRTNSPELVGKTAIFKGERKAIFAGYLIRINRIKELIDGDYLNYFLNSEVAKKYGMTVKTDGVNQSNINGQKLKGYPIPLCSLEIQNKIVQEIETRLSVCDKMEEIIENSLQQVESLRQSILKQAFEGKLI